MTWFGWLLIFWEVLSAIITITQVGKERDVITPNVAAGTIVVIGIFIACILFIGTGSL